MLLTSAEKIIAGIPKPKDSKLRIICTDDGGNYGENKKVMGSFVGSYWNSN